MPQNANTIITVLPFIFMLILFYVFIMIPERKRKSKYNAMLESLKINDEVLTRGGILGKVVKIQEDFIIIESGPDRTKLKLQKNALASILNEVAEVKLEK
jgi:preprotein translocase subunit YajC